MAVNYKKSETDSRLSIVFPSNIDLVSQAVNDALSFALKKAPGLEQFTFKLALFESLTNAVKHGCGFNPELDVKLQIEMKNSSLDIVIEDSGKGFDWRKKLEAEEEPQDLDKPSGRGLFLLKSYNCHPAFNDKGNVLSLRIDLV